MTGYMASCFKHYVNKIARRSAIALILTYLGVQIIDYSFYNDDDDDDDQSQNIPMDKPLKINNQPSYFNNYSIQKYIDDVVLKAEAYPLDDRYKIF